MKYPLLCILTYTLIDLIRKSKLFLFSFYIQCLQQGNLFDPLLDDMKDFKLITETMTKMGMSDSEKEAIFGLVAAVMHLGNILFEENHDDSKGGNNPVSYVVPPRLSLLCDV